MAYKYGSKHFFSILLHNPLSNTHVLGQRCPSQYNPHKPCLQVWPSSFYDCMTIVLHLATQTIIFTATNKQKNREQQSYSQKKKEITFYRNEVVEGFPSATETCMVGSSFFNRQQSGNCNLKEATPETKKHKGNQKRNNTLFKNSI